MNLRNLLVINPYKLSRIYLSLTFFWIGLICLAALVIRLPGRVAGIPVGYFPIFILITFFLTKLFERLKTNRSSVMFCLPFMLFFLVATVSTLFQVETPKKFALYTMIYLFELVILLLNYNMPADKVEKLVKLYTQYAVFVSLISLVLFFCGITFEKLSYGANLFGALGVNRNSFTFTIFPACIFSIIFYLHRKTNKNLIMMLILVVTIFFNFSRTAYAALFLLLVMIFMGTKYARVKKRMLKLFFALFLVLCIFSAGFPKQTAHILVRTQSLGRIYYIFGGKVLASNELGSLRQRLMKTYFQLFKERWMFGYGTGQILMQVGRLEHHVSMPHNTFLFILAENGLVGFLLFYGFLFKIFLCARRGLKNKDAPVEVVMVKSGLYYSFIGLILLSIGNEYIITNPFNFWILSLVVAYSKGKKTAAQSKVIPEKPVELIG